MNLHVTAPSLDGVLDRYPSVSVSDARATIATVIDGVNNKGQRHLITRHGRAVAAVVCMPDLLTLEVSDAAAQAALSWPEGSVDDSELLDLGTDPEATAMGIAGPADVEELMRKTDAAIRQNPRLAQIVSDMVDFAAPERATDTISEDMSEQAI